MTKPFKQEGGDVLLRITITKMQGTTTQKAQNKSHTALKT
jgi:hypothetical protein